jgi:uncharacterized protein YggE
VEGNGQASATPDLLTVTVGVAVTGPSAGAALTLDNTQTAAVLAAFSQGGVAPKDLQTTGLSVQRSYPEPAPGVAVGQPAIVVGNGRPRPAEYDVDNTVVAKLRDLSSAGSVIDAVVAAGGDATSIDSLVFSLDDQRRIEDRARLDAVRQAVSHAGSMAEGAGEHLGQLCTMTDDSTPIPSPLGLGIAGPADAARGGTSVPLSGGTEQVTARVTAVYALAAGR